MARGVSEEFMAVGSIEFIFACMAALWVFLTILNALS